MKITKLFLSIALVALTVISYGMSSKAERVEVENELIMESWMASPFEATESTLVIEQWMTLPFVSMENDLIMENWMTSHFGLGNELEDLALESWMTTLFDVTENDCTEICLVAACN